jgi:heme-degrading monooxygenase HmoA
MYAAIRRFRTDADMDEALRRADAEYTRAVECQLGFVEHRVVRTGPTEVMSVLLFETEAEVERNRSFSEQFIDVGFAGLDVTLLDEWRGAVQGSGAATAA